MPCQNRFLIGSGEGGLCGGNSERFNEATAGASVEQIGAVGTFAAQFDLVVLAANLGGDESRPMAKHLTRRLSDERTTTIGCFALPVAWEGDRIQRRAEQAIHALSDDVYAIVTTQFPDTTGQETLKRSLDHYDRILANCILATLDNYMGHGSKNG